MIFVSHDRYFVERLATKIIEVGRGTAVAYPGTYKEFLWHKEHEQSASDQPPATRANGATRTPAPSSKQGGTPPAPQARTRGGDSGPRTGHARPANPATASTRDERKRVDAEARKKAKASRATEARISALETQIADTEAALRNLEGQMAAVGFYDNRASAQPVIDQHQALLWTLGDLMHRWEQLQALESPASPGA